MTVKLVVLYTQPDDVDAFDEHYLGTHGPLVEKVPGLLRWEGAHFTSSADGGDTSYHRMAELWFEDTESMQQALATDESKAMGRDFRSIAPPGTRMFVAAVD